MQRVIKRQRRQGSLRATRSVTTSFEFRTGTQVDDRSSRQQGLDDLHQRKNPEWKDKREELVR